MATAIMPRRTQARTEAHAYRRKHVPHAEPSMRLNICSAKETTSRIEPMHLRRIIAVSSSSIPANRARRNIVSVALVFAGRFERCVGKV